MMKTIKYWYMQTYGSYLKGVPLYIYTACMIVAALFMTLILLLFLSYFNRVRCLNVFLSRLEATNHYNNAKVVRTFKDFSADGNGGKEFLTAAVLLKTDRKGFDELAFYRFYENKIIDTSECGDKKRVEFNLYLQPLVKFDLYKEAGLMSVSDEYKDFLKGIDPKKDKNSFYFIVYAYCQDVRQIFTGI